tara:strand:- start:2369 stop:2608 length:240 start_codon:yes stop_codon:yes gene_type:complete
MGFAHAVLHELHDLCPAALTIEHDDSDCLLADTPQAKSAVLTFASVFTISTRHGLPSASARVVKKVHSKASPRGPPISF